MPKRVSTPAGVIEFPDGMSPEDMAAAIPEAIKAVQQHNIANTKVPDPGFMGRHNLLREGLLSGISGFSMLPETDSPLTDAAKGAVSMMPQSVGEAAAWPVVGPYKAVKGIADQAVDVGGKIYKGMGSPKVSYSRDKGFSASVDPMDPEALTKGISKGVGTAANIYAAGAGADAINAPVSESPILRGGAKALTNPAVRGAGRILRDFDVTKPFSSMGDVIAGPATDAAADFLSKKVEPPPPAKLGIGRVPVADRIQPPPTEVPSIGVKPDAPYTPRTPKAAPPPAPVRRPMADIASEIAPDVEASASASADKLIADMKAKAAQPIPVGAPGSPAVEPLTPHPASPPQLVGGTERTGYTTGGQGGANYTPEQLAAFKSQAGIVDGPVQMVDSPAKPPMFPTEAKIAAEGYDENMIQRPRPTMYHGTSLDNLPSIAKDGLDPSKSQSMSLGDKGEWQPEPYTFLSESEPGATDYARGVTLRVNPSPETAASLRTDLGEFTRAPKTIPPSEISVERFPRIKGRGEVMDDAGHVQSLRDQMDAEQAALEEEQRAEWYRRNKPGRPKRDLINDMKGGTPQ